MKNTIAYVRCSSLTQNDGNSVAAQEACIEKYAHLHNMEVEKYYIDTDETDRSEYDQMIVDVQAGKVKAKAVLVKTMDRLHRDIMKAQVDANFFNSHNIRLIGIMDGIGEMPATETYSDIISQSIKSTFIKSAKELAGGE